MKTTKSYFKATRPDGSFTLTFWLKVEEDENEVTIKRGINEEVTDLYTYKRLNRWAFNKISVLNAEHERKRQQFIDDTNYVVTEFELDIKN